MINEKIFIALSTFGEYGNTPLRLLQESGVPYTVNPLKRRLVQAEIIEFGKECTGIIAGVEPYDAFVIDHLPQLRCISRCGIGVDAIAMEKARERTIGILTTPAEIIIPPVVELTVGMIFDLLRGISYHTELLKNKRWQKRAGHLLSETTIGILGLGRIGKRVAEVVRMLGANVCGTDPAPDRQWSGALGVNIVSLEELLHVSDVISIHASFLHENPLKLGEHEMNSMKKGVKLINVARGALIDEQALYRALQSGQVQAAALDVFPQEPYSGILCGLENVVLTPHIGTLTEESRLQMETQAVAQLLQWLGEQ